MDPDAVMSRLREAIAEYRAAEEYKDIVLAADEVVIAFEDLDEWMRKGGFPPREWVV